MAKVGGLLGGEPPRTGQRTDGVLSTQTPRSPGGAIGETPWAPRETQAQPARDRPSRTARQLRLPPELRQLRLHFVGPDVKALQQRLRRRQQIQLADTGVFDQATHDAVVRFQNAEMLTPHGAMNDKSWFKVLRRNVRSEPPKDEVNPLVPEWCLEERFAKIIENTSANRPDWRQSLAEPKFVIDGLVTLAGQTLFGDDNVFTIAESKLNGVPSADRFEIAAMIEKVLNIACRALTVHDIETGVTAFTDLLEATGIDNLIRVLERRGPAGTVEREGEAAPEEAPAAGVREAPDETLERIAFRLVDEDGEPLIGAKYEITMPDGEVVPGTIESGEFVEFPEVPPGDCTIVFKELVEAVRQQ